MNTKIQNDTEEQAEASIEQYKQPLEISTVIKDNLNTTGKWSQFLAILGLVGIGFMVMAGIIMSVVMSVVPEFKSDELPFSPALIGIIYLLIASVYLFPVLYLMRFSANIKQALFQNSQEKLAKAFASLKSHYKTVGIIMIVFLCLYPIMLIALVVFGAISNMPGSDVIPG